ECPMQPAPSRLRQLGGRLARMEWLLPRKDLLGGKYPPGNARPQAENRERQTIALREAEEPSKNLLELRLGVLVLQELIGRQHGDAVPRADLVAERAADAAGKIDGADLE